MKYLLGIDSGLTITKAVLFQTDGKPVFVARKRIKQLFPKEHFVERDMHELWSVCAAVIKDVINASGIDSKDIIGVSQTAHGDGVYILDKSRQPLGNGIVSLDSRAHETIADWKQNGVSQQSLLESGQEPGISSPAAIIAWIKNNDLDRYDKIGSILSCKDYIRFCLTGEICTDRTEASTSFTNVHTQNYSSKILEIFDLEEIQDSLPSILNSTDIAGFITSDAAQKTGLKVGTPVATGLHDVCASALGMNAHESNELAIISGTYSINQVVSSKPQISSNWYCRNSIEAGFWNNMAISPASSGNFDWYVNSLLQGEDGDHPKLAKQAENILSSYDNTILFHPFLYGSPYSEDASASLIGLRGWHDQDSLTAAVLEGIVFNHCVHIEELSSIFKFKKVSLSGGISRNSVVAQYFADALNENVEVSEIDEAACWGAAICAGVACGAYQNLKNGQASRTSKLKVYKPVSSSVSHVKRRYDVYKKTINNFSEVWRELSLLARNTSC